MPNRRPAPATVRFWEKVEKSDGCWLWLGGTKGNGYGVFWDGTHQVCAHRFAWINTGGIIPPDMEIDHLCYVRNCVRPDHLRVVTHAENMKAGRAAMATHCQRGHLFTDDRDAANGRRFCIECRRIRERAAYAALVGRTDR